MNYPIHYPNFFTATILYWNHLLSAVVGEALLLLLVKNTNNGNGQ